MEIISYIVYTFVVRHIQTVSVMYINNQYAL